MQNNILFLFFVIIATTTINAGQYNPVANPAAIVTAGNARFTVLTPRVIRMEWAKGAKFTDEASLTFVNRNLPVPEFTQKDENGYIEISTGSAKLKYKKDSGIFTADNLSVEFNADGKTTIWKPGMENKGNLLGTTRTLDGCNGAPKSIEPGLISRDGWVMIDDSQRPLFDNSDWPWVMARPETKQQDLYLFVYGSNYKQALKDFTSIAGNIAMPPRFAFGAWWSRYREYTDTQFRELVDDFKTHDVPLDVLVIDIDWHIRWLPEFYKNGNIQRDQAGESFGWTGYTWDKNYFPDPDKFLKWTNDQNIKTCMNLHPASGVQPFEEKYPEMAKAMGIDPASKKYVPFDITDKKFATNYMNIMLHPYEKSGVDFWWLDWQQWGTTKIAGVNPTFYLNYVFYSDMERQNKTRPLIFHRWGGLGNHRYQIGFSGDTYITWKSLDFQPYFTATAANVGFGYWSHDIGGHMGEPDSPELYTRWIQWGIFSPIFRTHCTSSPQIERRIWGYPLNNFNIMRNAYLLRYSLIPYIYNEAYNTYQTGVSTVHPMYYDYPENENAYAFKNQYMFGRDVMVSPITRPIGEDSIYLLQKVWLPRGNWYELSTGTLLTGDKVCELPFTIEDIPVFIKEGAIIPMQLKASRVENKQVDPLILSVYPGNKGSLRLYEDEGNNNNFKNGAFVFTPVSFTKESGNMELTISPAEGSFPGMLTQRAYELRFPCSFAPEKVTLNNNEIAYSSNDSAGTWNYKGSDFETRIHLPELPVDKPVIVKIQFPDSDIKILSAKKAVIKYMNEFEKFRVDNYWYKGLYDASAITAVSQTAQSIEYNPQSMKNKIELLDRNFEKSLYMIQRIGKRQKVYLPYYNLLKQYGSITESPVINLQKGNDDNAAIEITGAKNDKIFYTTNGSEPTINSTLYTSPFKIKLPVLVKAIAVSAENDKASSPTEQLYSSENSRMNFLLYHGDWENLPDFSKLTPVKKGTVPNFNYQSASDSSTYFGIVYTGFLNIPEDGDYTFFISSDDGSRLLINKKEVVRNDGAHSMEEVSGKINLKKGTHPFTVEYFQQRKDLGLEVEFESDKIERTSIVPLYIKLHE